MIRYYKRSTGVVIVLRSLYLYYKRSLGFYVEILKKELKIFVPLL